MHNVYFYMAPRQRIGLGEIKQDLVIERGLRVPESVIDRSDLMFGCNRFS